MNERKRAFFILKSTFTWSTPLDVEYDLHMSTVVSINLYASQVWHADTQMLRKLENSQKLCFYWFLTVDCPNPES